MAYEPKNGRESNDGKDDVGRRVSLVEPDTINNLVRRNDDDREQQPDPPVVPKRVPSSGSTCHETRP